VDEIAWMLDQYRRHHPGWTVKHFHEHLQERHSFRWGPLSVAKTVQEPS